MPYRLISGIALILCLALLPKLSAGESEMAEGKKYISDEIKAIAEKAMLDALKISDGGESAKKACRIACDLNDVDILKNILLNKNYSVRLYCVETIQSQNILFQKELLKGALRKNDIWIKELKVGELIAGQEVFNDSIVALVNKIVGHKAITRDELADADARNKVIDILERRDEK